MPNLLIELSIEACCLENEMIVNNPLGSYERLPWETKDRHRDISQNIDVNYENAYLSDEVLAPPFKNDNSLLKQGVHLHWIVPTFLGREHNGTMKAAPNRWHIIRYRNEEIKEWMVISDYVQYPKVEISNKQIINGVEHSNIKINYLDDLSVFPNLNRQDGEPPFCYVGKSFPIGKLPSNKELEKYSFENIFKSPLTILGFGSPQFSASYPNCRSVFGFHDDEGRLGDNYSVVGWHYDPKDDLLLEETIKAAREFDEKRTQDNYGTEEHFNIKKYLQDKFGIDTGRGKLSIPTEKTLYVAKVVLDKKPQSIPHPQKLKVIVANTVTEAFSCIVADKKAGKTNKAWSKKVELEDQLESMILNNVLEDGINDKFSAFFEARHKLGFVSVNAGTLYALKNVNIGQTQEFDGIPLSNNLKEELNALNLLKHKINKAKHGLDCLKEQLYADWYKYMRASYIPLGARGNLPDANKLRHLIKVADLNLIRRHKNQLLRHVVEERYRASNIRKLYFDEIKNAKILIAKKTDELNNLKMNVDSSRAEKIDEEIKKYKDCLIEIEKEISIMEKSKSHELSFLNDTDKKNIIDTDSDVDNESLERILEKEFEIPPILKEIPDVPYWEAKEPVVAVLGFNSSKRHIKTIAKYGIKLWSENDDFPNVPQKVFNRLKTTRLSSLAWSPLLMEWEVDIKDAPIKLDNNFNWEGSEIFREHFYLDQYTPGIYRNSKAKTHPHNESYLQGSVILNPLLDQVFLKGLEAYSEKMKTHSDSNDEVIKNSLAFAEESIKIIKRSNIFTQRLSGFNATCIMLRNSPQLRIEEPLGFESYKEFSKSVQDFCKGVKTQSPLPMLHFLPIRNGELEILRLKFIDNFGQTTTLDKFDSVISSDTLTSVELRNEIGTKITHKKGREFTRQIFLPPRLSQPARLNLHFLNNNAVEYTGYENSQPIYGWFLPNFHDETIMVYAAEGEALGSLAKEKGWSNLPWEDKGISFQDKIKNEHFKAVIQQILDLEDQVSNPTNIRGRQSQKEPVSYISSFIEALRNAQANIAPSDFALHDSRVLFAGHPIAITRVGVSLEVKGFAALDQSWTSTYLDTLKSATKSVNDILLPQERFSTQWDSINLPLRLGEHSRLNDGVLGYWREADKGLDSIFYAPETDIDDSKFIESQRDGKNGQNFIIDIKPNGEQLNFTVLLDPRGTIHVTTGILPTTTLNIGTKTYKTAIEKMFMWFETGPTLQFKDVIEDNIMPDENTLPMNVPQIDGFEWGWFSKNNPTPNTMALSEVKYDTIYGRLPEITTGYLILMPVGTKDVELANNEPIN